MEMGGRKPGQRRLAGSGALWPADRRMVAAVEILLDKTGELQGGCSVSRAIPRLSFTFRTAPLSIPTRRRWTKHLQTAK
jgi:hypothetical protein